MKQAKFEGEVAQFRYRIPKEFKDRVVRQAQREDRSINLLVLDALEMYLKEHEPKQED